MSHVPGEGSREGFPEEDPGWGLGTGGAETV